MSVGGFDLEKYRVDLPYPEIKVKDKNLEYAKLLHDDYAGFVSEMSAITQYVYGHLVTDKVNEKVTATLEGIAMAEMKHLELLGKAIIALGGNPVYWGTYNNMDQYWNASYVSYSKDVKQLLMDNIKGEQDAIYQYKRHIYIIRDPHIQELLSRIVMDEKLHLTILTKLLNENL